MDEHSAVPLAAAAAAAAAGVFAAPLAAAELPLLQPVAGRLLLGAVVPVWLFPPAALAFALFLTALVADVWRLQPLPSPPSLSWPHLALS